MLSASAHQTFGLETIGAIGASDDVKRVRGIVVDSVPGHLRRTRLATSLHLSWDGNDSSDKGHGGEQGLEELHGEDERIGSGVVVRWVVEE